MAHNVTDYLFAAQDVTSHPSWTGGKVVTSDDGQIARFRRRFVAMEDEAEDGKTGKRNNERQ